MTDTAVVAAIQLSSQDDLTSNLDRLSALVARAAERGAEFIVLPENFAYMGDDAGKRAIAERIDASASAGPIVERLAHLAVTHRVRILAGGMPERSDDPARPYNTSVAVSASGVVEALYRKIHLFDVDVPGGGSYRESDASLAGRDVVVVPHGAFHVGMTICYDLRFPELYRALVAKGANVLTVPAAFTLHTGKDHWHALLRARAIENQSYLIAAAQHGKHPRGRETYGKSVIIDPWGDVIAQATDGEGIAVAEIDLERVLRVRAALPCLAHRRL